SFQVTKMVTDRDVHHEGAAACRGAANFFRSSLHPRRRGRQAICQFGLYRAQWICLSCCWFRPNQGRMANTTGMLCPHQVAGVSDSTEHALTISLECALPERRNVPQAKLCLERGNNS